MTDTDRPLPSDLVDRLLTGAVDARVLVVGDVMLDEYVTGSVERHSPEAPVPVLRATGQSANLGGAANVARQLSAFRPTVELAGVIGTDEAGDRILEACRAARIGTDLLLRDPSTVTTRKQRLVADGRQIARIDHEDRRPLDDDARAILDERLGELDPPDVVIVSDYGKGAVTDDVLADVLAHARRWGAPVLVDPAHGAPFRRYRGVDLVKANRVEFERATGAAVDAADLRAVEHAGRTAMAHAELPQLVVTLGPLGLLALEGEAEAIALRPATHQVFDVGGAGDTVIALLALSRALGEPLSTAAHLANEAAGIVVTKAGVSVATPTELVDRITEGSAAKVRSRGALRRQVEDWRAAGRTVVFTNGCFDLLHRGHLHLLRRAAELGGVLVVGMNSDRSVRALKGADRPILAEQERAALLSGLSCVDAVVVFDEDDPALLIDELQPDVLVKGADYQVDQIVGAASVQARGGSVVTIDLISGVSSSAVADRLRRAGAAPPPAVPAR